MTKRPEQPPTLRRPARARGRARARRYRLGDTRSPRDVVDELFKGGAAAPLAHRLDWKLPPVTFFCLRALAEQPQMRGLAAALRDAVKGMKQPRGGAKGPK
jgi:hypothetical protein